MKLKKRSISKAVLILSIGTLISKILGFVRELVVAYKFGAGSITDAFVLTNSIPPIIFSALGSAITISYIPIYQSINDSEEKNYFTSCVANFIAVILVIGCVLICFFPRFVLSFFGAGMPEETRKYATVMLRIATFSFIPASLAHLFKAFSQSNGNFWSTSAYGVVTNIVIIVITMFAVDETYWMLSVGTVMASIIGLVMVTVIALKSGFRYCLALDLNEAHLSKMFKLAIPLIIEDVASNMTILVDRNLASFLSSGTISGLGYAGTLGNVASVLISSSIVTATFPAFSKMISRGKQADFEKEFTHYGKIIICLMCPISAALIFFAKDVVVLVFQHGAFSTSASKIVWESLICYAIGIVPSAMQTYYLRLFYALKDTKTPVIIKLLSFSLNIILNIASYKLLGHIGIALSTSLSFVAAYYGLGFFLNKKYKYESIKYLSIKMIVSIIWISMVAFLINILFGRIIIVKSLFARLSIELFVFVIIYLVVELVVDAPMVKRVIK